MGKRVNVREAHQQNLGETGYLHLDGRWITSIRIHHNVTDMYHVELAATRDDRARSSIEYGSTMIEYTPDAPATDAAARIASYCPRCGKKIDITVGCTETHKDAAPDADDLLHDLGVLSFAGIHIDKDDAESLRTEEGGELYNHLKDVQGKIAEATARAERAESALAEVTLSHVQLENAAQLTEFHLMAENKALREMLAQALDLGRHACHIPEQDQEECDATEAQLKAIQAALESVS